MRIFDGSAIDAVADLIFSPDPVGRFMHEKVYGAQRGSADDQAVRELMLAVSEDAIACFESTNAKLVREAEEWVNSDDDEVFSFNNVCESLSLDPDRLRKGLLRWKAQQMGVPLEERSRLILSKGKRGKKKTQVKA